MKLEYYFFALFIAALACLVAILCKVLFADIKRQNKMLDEKEKKLLDLYRSVENIMEEFHDQSTAALDEMREYESRAAIRMVTQAVAPQPAPAPEKKETKERLPRADEVDTDSTSRRKAASEALDRADKLVNNQPAKKAQPTATPAGRTDAPVFQRLFDDAIDEQKPPANENEAKQQRSEKILAMSKDGKKTAQIAKELGITQNEVKLVIELGGNNK
jgi:hypothetical protein